MEYAIVIELMPPHFSADAPDLPGCVAAGATWAMPVREMCTAIALHIESLLKQSEPVPAPRCTTAMGEVTDTG